MEGGGGSTPRPPLEADSFQGSSSSEVRPPEEVPKSFSPRDRFSSPEEQPTKRKRMPKPTPRRLPQGGPENLREAWWGRKHLMRASLARVCPTTRR
jgi:hypothetical protein